MRTPLLTLIMLSLILLSCQRNKEAALSEDQLRSIWFPPKAVDANQYSVWATGHWKQIRFGLITRVPVLNAVSIVCSKVDNTCSEARADLYSPLDKHQMFSGHMRLDVEQPDVFKVQAWSKDNTITAVRQTDSADLELRISVADNAAEKTYRETKARGNTSADPNMVHVWVLQ